MRSSAGSRGISRQLWTPCAPAAARCAARPHAARPSCRSIFCVRPWERLQHLVDVLAAGRHPARVEAISDGAPVVGLLVQRLDQRHRLARGAEPVHEALHAGVDDGLGLLDGGWRFSPAVCTSAARSSTVQRSDVGQRHLGSMSRGTARSTMNIGARCAP